MKVAITLHSKLGKFESSEMDMKRNEYEELVVDNHHFYDKDLYLPIDNGYVIFPPNVTKESILEIKIVKKHAAE